ncbi:hypothetical protein SAMN05421788_11529 [Filimonas lacunae]|uniref:Uncharacterized protein n=1 Tax=Filimonas lacunae TaxID=477680 RepID=A0A173MCE5_9BACT|nr:hypothetical protein [Filimonas lacunae]BAV05131.1 hypothetical protein FLA_1138 [Filimonas lacunae]SIT34182.1 hypothetical protein SAMN05421788_11529 [Filimonas lacunae]
MEDYIINVSQIEELQMIKDVAGLEEILQRAKVNIVRGGQVVLVRVDAAGNQNRFDTFTNLEEMTAYRKNVLKYLL